MGANEVKKGADKQIRTRCYYSDYVNHAIRFYLTTPETLKLEGKRKADLENWVAVQTVLHNLGAEKRAIVEEVYRAIREDSNTQIVFPPGAISIMTMGANGGGPMVSQGININFPKGNAVTQ